jgi:hypothetical protein
LLLQLLRLQAPEVGVEAERLGLRIDLADIGAEGAALLLQALDALDELAQPLAGDAALLNQALPLG